MRLVRIGSEYQHRSHSYDERVVFWDTRTMKRPMTDVKLPGGVWRIKHDPFNGSLIACPCMYGGSVVLDGATCSILATYDFHENINYGMDWCCETWKDCYLLGVCSFYDNLLSLATLKYECLRYGVLDMSTCGAVAQGLALTDRWRSEIPRLFKMIEQGGAQPSSSNWATAVEAAWLHGDEKSAWEFMDAAAMSGRHLIPKIVQVVLEHPLTFKPLLRFLLPDVQLRRIFSKWQALHQYHPLHVSEADGRVFLRAPLKSVREAQALRPDLWHVPVVDHSQTNVEGHLQDERAPWLCVKFEN
ncbi:unnamed protein product [Nesidiocoris tenuis]|uniref:Uncharacterized protein n=1 Tax=Nesidiocoris tenuis TaxID=355587 RepID=A0A6H5G736_9HEMI|nr:unnamed protein product [Nesidiocoris tenuis]